MSEPNKDSSLEGRDDGPERDSSSGIMSRMADYAMRDPNKTKSSFSGNNKESTDSAGPKILIVANEIFTSGVFFILLGVAFLVVASRYMGSEHSSFSFVTVVLGIAILLYGTGTQSVGKFQSGVATVYVAGGAGVLTFCVAFGMIYYQESIRTAFQIEKKYFILRVEPHDDGSSNFEKFTARFTMDGIDIPAMKQGKTIVVYVPFLATDTNRKPKIEYELFYVGEDAKNSKLLVRPQGSFKDIEIVSANFKSKTAGYDFPEYKVQHQIDLRDPAPIKEAGTSSAPPKAMVPKDVPPVVFSPGAS